MCVLFALSVRTYCMSRLHMCIRVCTLAMMLLVFNVHPLSSVLYPFGHICVCVFNPLHNVAGSMCVHACKHPGA